MGGRTWRAWTTGELRRLEELREAGTTALGIALEMGRTLASIRNRLRERGVVKPLAGNRYLRLLVRPHTLRQVAAALGVSVGAVKQQKRKLRRAGYDIPAAQWEYAGRAPAEATFQSRTERMPRAHRMTIGSAEHCSEA